MDFRLFNVGIFSFVLTFILPTQIYAEEEITQHQTLAGEFVKIPGGELNIYGKSVTIESFEMGKYEVTQAQWEAVMEYNPISSSSFPLHGIGNNYPAYHVNWYDCLSFCNQLSEIDGRIPGWVEISSGVNQGDRVVRDGVVRLRGDSATVSLAED